MKTKNMSRKCGGMARIKKPIPEGWCVDCSYNYTCPIGKRRREGKELEETIQELAARYHNLLE